MYDSSRADGWTASSALEVQPASDELLLPNKFKLVVPVQLFDESRQYELWCR